MKSVKITETVIEREEVLIVSRGLRLEGLCETCGCVTEFISPERGALVMRATTRTLYRLIETNSIHFKETPEGLLLVCARSLTP